MRSNLFLLMLASAASIWPSSAIASGQTISNAGRNSVDVILELDNATLTPVDRNGVLYTKIHADGFGIETREGLPALPISLIKILTARDPAVQVICDVVKADTIRNILVHPAQQHAPAIANVPDQPTPFVLDKCYSADEPVPASPSYVASTMLLSGMPLTTVVLSPVSYNPVRKELILYRQVKFHVSYAAADPSPFVGMRPNQRDQLASAACNASSFALALARSYSAVATAGRNDVLIITTTAYKDAAETLAVWQRMKGLGSVVDARASWSSDAVKTRTTVF